MAARPRISVYLPSHNYGKYLGEAVESVLRQTVKDWELIVIDDNSTDNTQDVMNLYRGHPSISLYRTEGIGLPAVCNLALRKARGRYVIRLDGDDAFDENILLVLGNYLDINPEVAMVFPDYFLVDEQGEVFAHKRRRQLYSRNHVLDVPPNGACAMVRKSVLAEVGGYREDLGAQDGLDLWTKLGRRYRTRNVNVPLFYYRRHGENLTGDVKRILAARRQIKRDTIRERLAGIRPIMAVIPCRRYYDFELDLWKQEINGQSLLERDIDVCLGCDIFDHVVVACDNAEAKEVVAWKRNARLRFFPREPKSTLRSASIVPTLETIAAELDPNLRGVTVMRYIQTPFVTTQTLEEAVTTLVLNDTHSAYAVEELDSPLYRRTPHGLQLINHRGELASDFDTVYRDAKTCVAVRNSNLPSGSLSGPSIASFVVSAAECFFIDSRESLRLAELMALEAC